MSAYWPIADLRLYTPRLELRLPTPDDLQDLADLAAEGIHDPAVMPFSVPWTDAEPAARARSVLQWQWRAWAEWKPERWRLELAVVTDTPDGRRAVGVQAIGADQFGRLREVFSGSWLGRRHQGRGIGTEMRDAVLHLAFVGLGAEYAVSGAFDDNAASLAVSRKLGYARDGVSRMLVRDRPATLVRLRLDRATWERHRTVDVRIEGLDACREMFGLTDEPSGRPQAAVADPASTGNDADNAGSGPPRDEAR